MQFGKQNTLMNLWYSWPVIITLSAAFLLLAVSVFERYQVEREMAARAAAAAHELEALQNREDELTTRVSYLEGERGVEEELRKNFDVAKAGEQVVILTGEPPAPPLPPPPEEVPRRWYQFWR